jgi:DNA-binding beta-propeller fold protein YncE
VAALAAISMLAAAAAAGSVVLAPAASAAGLPHARRPPPAFRQAFGQRTLEDPYGVALDPDGDVWVADTGHDRVAEFTPAGRLVASFGLPARLGGLDQPEGIAVDAAGHVWVADTGLDRVVEFSSAGRVLAIVGSPGSGRGQLDQPAGLTISPFGDIWVADQGNNRVEEFSAFGRYRASIRVPSPAGVALDQKGNLWVTSAGRGAGGTVEEFTPSGRRLRSFGTAPTGPGAAVGGIAVGPAGHVYVAQPGPGLVSEFTPAGRLDTDFGRPPHPRQPGEDLQFPRGVAVTTKSQVWVADSGHNRIAEFGAVPGSAAPAAPGPVGGPPVALIVGECLLALILAGLGWFLARRGRRAAGDSGQAADESVTPARPR